MEKFLVKEECTLDGDAQRALLLVSEDAEENNDSVKAQQSLSGSYLIKNYEMKLRGKWIFGVLPFATKEYFICHEGEYTIIGARLKVGKTRKEMTKILIDLQEGTANEIPEMKYLKVDECPFLSSKPRWGSITKCHPLITLPKSKITRKKEGSVDYTLDQNIHEVIKHFNIAKR